MLVAVNDSPGDCLRKHETTQTDPDNILTGVQVDLPLLLHGGSNVDSGGTLGLAVISIPQQQGVRGVRTLPD